MTRMGWVFLIVSWGCLTCWTVWCFHKVFSSPFDRDDEEIPPTL